MLKRLFLLVFVALATSCSTDDLPAVAPQDLETKNVEFRLFTDEDFSETRFDEAYVKVEIVLIKEDRKGNLTEIFSKTYNWMHFRDFPKAANSIIEQQSLVYDTKTSVVYASYGIYTKIDGYLASEGVSFTLTPGITEHLVEVKL